MMNVAKTSYYVFINALFVIYLYGIFFFPAAAYGAAECDHSGCVRVETRDLLGQPTSGATAELRLPGPDGELMKGLDLTVSEMDGVVKGPGADDGAAADGDVEFNVGALDKKLKSGAPIMITVKAPNSGLAAWSTTTLYVNDKPMALISENKYILDVSIKNEKGEAVPGLTVSAAGRAALDGGENDADGAADGMVHFAGPALPAGQTAVRVLSSNGDILFEKPVTLDPAAAVSVGAVVNSQ